MNKLFILLFLPILAASSLAGEHKQCRTKPIKIAVLDTGFGYQGKGEGAKLCKFGHRDFTTDQKFLDRFIYYKMPIPKDLHGHGTNVVGLIDKYAKASQVPYCIVVLKYYREQNSGEQNMHASNLALQYAINIGVDVINYSGGGEVPNEREQALVKEFLDRGGVIVAAAGNENKYLDGVQQGYYPALDDDRVITVGNHGKFGFKAPSSNFGHLVKRWEVGQDITSYGITMSGTSQATAIATGKIVIENFNKCSR